MEESASGLMCLNEGMFKGAKVVASRRQSREDSQSQNDRGRRAVTLKLQEKDGKGGEEMHRKRAMHSR